MPSFYDVLGIPRGASVEEIRKAYKKKALATHPDRLGLNPTAELKAEAEENFRLVNNAYEVLNDADNRKLYDKYGVWPPPRPGEMDEPAAQGTRHRPRRSERPSGHHQSSFTDPFENFQRHFNTDIPNMRHGHFQNTRDLNDIFRSMDAMFDRFNDPFGPFGYAPPPPPRRSRPFEGTMPFGISISTGGGFTGGFGATHSTTFSSSTRVGSESETYKETIVNGVKHSILKKVDRNGNVHITETDSNGRKKYSINGIVQQPAIPDQRPVYISLDSRPYPNNRSSPPRSPHRKSPPRRHSPEFNSAPHYEPPADWSDKVRSVHHRHHSKEYDDSDDDEDYPENPDRNHLRHRRHSPTYEYGNNFHVHSTSPKRNRWWPFH